MRKRISYKSRIIQHLIFWLLAIVFWLLTMFVASEFKNVMKLEPLVITILFNVCFAIAVYINLYLLLPLLFKRQRFFSYVVCLLALVAITALVIDLLLVYPLNSLVNDENYFGELSFMVWFNFAFFTVFYLGLTTFFSFIREWFHISMHVKDVEKQKLEAELKALKGQLNPHFLFNSLNNIYSLTLDRSEKAPELVLRLSDMMRYILYECNDRYVDIEKELEFVENYLEVQRIRLDEDNPVKFQIKGCAQNQRIAPLLLEPLIENAFKHGTSRRNQEAFVNIIFNFERAGFLKLLIENSCEELGNINGERKSGIGIQNVKRRLELLYAGKYNLNIQQKEDWFQVVLELELV